MTKAHFGIQITAEDGNKTFIDNITIPVLRGTMETANHLPGTKSTAALLCFDDGINEYEIELTDCQISSLNLQSFRKADPKKPWAKS